MLVSIIITNYNYQAYLREAIDSALQQTHPEVEVLVVDDGSLDDSRSIIDSYGARITPVYKTNGGHLSSVNLGFEKSHGDVAIFLDADDALLPDAAAQHAARLSDPSVVKSSGYLRVVDTDGRLTTHAIPGRLSPSGDYRAATLKWGLDVYRGTFTSGNAWSRAFLTRVMPLPDRDAIDNLIGPDGYLAAVDVLFGRVESIDAPVGRYRIHGSNNGPVNFHFGAAHLRKRLECRRRRTEFAVQTAARLGLNIDTRRFSRLNDWKLNLMNQALTLMEQDAPPPFVEFVASPFHREPGGPVKALVLSSCFVLVRLLPTRLALRFAHRLLRLSAARHAVARSGRRRA